MSSGASHEPVMLTEVLNTFNLKPGMTVVDGTLGLAGHSIEMARRISPGGTLLGIDWDSEMLERAKDRLAQIQEVAFKFFRRDYRALPQCVEESGVQPDAILLDLGLNNAQIEDPSRGITFRQDGPLDMRMDRTKGEPASAWLNRASAHEIERVLFELGDERWAKRIAQVIIDRRKSTPLHTTFDLVNCIEAAVPKAMRDKRLHVATRSFQAIRIYINEELDGLQEAIGAAARTLAQSGTLVTLAYHSGEDRAAKTAIKDLVATGDFQDLTRKPLVPTEAEVLRNPKSRSAKLRAVKKKP